MKSVVKETTFIFVLAALVFSLTACDPMTNPKDEHTHTFSKEWTSDAEYHWHKATCEHTDQISDKAKHTFGEWKITKELTMTEDGLKERVCSVCKYKEEQVIKISDVLTEQEKTSVKSLKYGTFSESLDSIDTILNILNNHTDDFSDDILDILSVIKSTKDLLPLSFESSNYAELEKVIFELGNKKTNADNKYNADSFSIYDTLYDNAGISIDSYNSAYDEYETSKNAYKTSETAYNSLVSKAKSTVKDFQDDYTFQDTYNVDEIGANIDSAVGIENKKDSYEAANENTAIKQQEAERDIYLLNNYSLELTSGGNEDPQGGNEDPQGGNEDPQGGDQDPQGGNEDPQGGNEDPQGGNQDPVFNRTPTITLGDTVSTDWHYWEDIDSVTLALPENATEIDVVGLARLKNQIQSGFESVGDTTERTISFAEYPETATTFKLDIASSGKSNVELMKEFVNPKTVDVGAEKAEKSTEVIPGVSINTYAEVWYNKGYDGNILHQTFKFSDDKDVNVTLPTEYNLTGTYKGGIVGDNVNFTNLNSSHISGKLLINKDNIDNFYNVFAKDKSASELAKIDLEANYEDGSRVSSQILDIDVINMYNTKLNDLIKIYADNGKLDNITFSGGDSIVFDSENTNNMYNGNNYVGNSTPVDINTVIKTGAALSNVVISGNNKVGENIEFDGRLGNVRFESDMSGINLTGSARGVIEFVDDAPAKLENPSRTFVVFNKISHETILGTVPVLDLRNLTDHSQLNNIKPLNLSTGISDELLGASELNGFLVVKSQENPTYSKQQWESAANQGKHPSELVGKLTPNQNINKSDLIRNKRFFLI